MCQTRVESQKYTFIIYLINLKKLWSWSDSIWLPDHFFLDIFPNSLFVYRSLSTKWNQHSMWLFLFFNAGWVTAVRFYDRSPACQPSLGLLSMFICSYILIRNQKIIFLINRDVTTKWQELKTFSSLLVGNIMGAITRCIIAHAISLEPRLFRH